MHVETEHLDLTRAADQETRRLAGGRAYTLGDLLRRRARFMEIALDTFYWAAQCPRSMQRLVLRVYKQLSK